MYEVCSQRTLNIDKSTNSTYSTSASSFIAEAEHITIYEISPVTLTLSLREHLTPDVPQSEVILCNKI